MKVYSIGMNCEVSFQIERIYGKIDSSLFSWAFVHDEYLFLECLSNIDDLFNREIVFHKPSSDMFIDLKYQIAFHSRYNSYDLFDSEWNIINGEGYDTAKKELYSRVGYLKEKFRLQLCNNEPKLFMKKIWLEDEDEESRRRKCIEIISGLDDFFRNYAINYKLIIILDERSYFEEFKDLENDVLFIRKIKFYSPWEDTKFGADDESYDAIFREFDDEIDI